MIEPEVSPFEDTDSMAVAQATVMEWFPVQVIIHLHLTDL